MGLRNECPNDNLQSLSALVQAAYKINAQNVISLSGWAQQYDRQIPPALFETYSVKNETDASLRLLAAGAEKQTIIPGTPNHPLSAMMLIIAMPRWGYRLKHGLPVLPGAGMEKKIK